jgi:hypothetical protein
LLDDFDTGFRYAKGELAGENSEPLLCSLEHGVDFPASLTMLFFPGDPLMKRVNEIIDRVVEAGLFNHWISLEYNFLKLFLHSTGIVHLLDVYYNFKLYHMQPAYYLLLMGCCLSTLCFMVEVLYKRLLSKVI